MAKSPTPIPAPPVKIQRDTNGAAPAAPAAKPKKAAPQKRRKRRRNPLLWFLHGLIRRIYFGLKTASRLVLLVPILVFMVAFSYNVDRSGLFQGALAPRRIVDLMLQGYDVTNFEQMDERQVVQLFAQDVEQAPEGPPRPLALAPAACCSSTGKTPAWIPSLIWALPARTCATI